MTFHQYSERRRANYSDQSNELMIRFHEFATNRQNEEGQARVIEIIQQIERREI